MIRDHKGNTIHIYHGYIGHDSHNAAELEGRIQGYFPLSFIANNNWRGFKNHSSNGEANATWKTLFKGGE